MQSSCTKVLLEFHTNQGSEDICVFGTKFEMRDYEVYGSFDDFLAEVEQDASAASCQKVQAGYFRKFISVRLALRLRKAL